MVIKTARSTTPERFLADAEHHDWKVVRRAVENATTLLREGKPSPPVAESIGRRLAELAAHPKWEVREAVALSIPYLRSESFHLAAARLVEDDHSYVSNAARRALARRSSARASDSLREQRRNLLLGELSQLEARYGSRAREIARAAAEKYAGWIIDEARHEVDRVNTALDLSLHSLREALERRPTDRKAASKDLDVAMACVELLSGINASLRGFTQRVTPVFHPEDMMSCLDEAIRMVRARLKLEKRDFVVELNIEIGLPLVECHRFRLQQAFLNILQNAYESYDGLGKKRRLEVAVAANAEGQVVLEFRDRGAGMTEEAAANAFRLFGSSKAQGRGFGLATAQKIIELEHHGSIELKTRKGEGTTITIALPFEQEAHE